MRWRILDDSRMGSFGIVGLALFAGLALGQYRASETTLDGMRALATAVAHNENVIVADEKIIISNQQTLIAGQEKLLAHNETLQIFPFRGAPRLTYSPLPKFP